MYYLCVVAHLNLSVLNSLINYTIFSDFLDIELLISTDIPIIHDRHFPLDHLKTYYIVSSCLSCDSLWVHFWDRSAWWVCLIALSFLSRETFTVLVRLRCQHQPTQSWSLSEKLIGFIGYLWKISLKAETFAEQDEIYAAELSQFISAWVVVASSCNFALAPTYKNCTFEM